MLCFSMKKEKEFTSPLESATRKRIDEILKNIGWKTDEFGKECNVFTERPRTTEERKKIIQRLKGMIEDYKTKKEEYKKDLVVREKAINGYMESLL